jgi:hypothetical protein
MTNLFQCCFCFVCLRPVSCVPNVASVSGLSILDCPLGFLWHYFNYIIWFSRAVYTNLKFPMIGYILPKSNYLFNIFVIFLYHFFLKYWICVVEWILQWNILGTIFVVEIDSCSVFTGYINKDFLHCNYTPAPRRGRGVYCFTSVRLSILPSFAFFSTTIDGRNLIFGHKLHIGTPYRGKRFLTRQIPTSCLLKSRGIIGEH